MKVIDLLNKIANGEKIPEKIKLTTPVFKNIKILTYSKKYNAYYDEENFPLPTHLSDNLSNLNDEIEILEDEIDIYNIGEIKNISLNKKGVVEFDTVKDIAVTLNEVVKAVKQLDRKFKVGKKC